MKHPTASRRAFLHRAAVLGSVVAPRGLPLALSLLSGSAAISQSSDYRALVCLFMIGGNDAANMVVPTDSASWQAYREFRGRQPFSLALLEPGTAPDPSARPGTPGALGGLLPIAPLFEAGDPNSSRRLTLHPVMADTARLFDTGRLAIVANVGPLIEPLNKTEYLARSKRLPPRLFSHNDQVSTWQALAPDGARVGWGGQLADRVAGLNASTVFTSVSTSGRAVFLSGDNTSQY